MADSPGTAETAPQQDDPEYRVLARKYRPATFDELIGQDVLVRTLTNAIRLNRVHHAFILTGVRGIGKTTTARLIARALNCVGPHGNGGPTIEPCGVCAHCVAIAEDRDVDVLEMDAASNTGRGRCPRDHRQRTLSAERGALSDIHRRRSPHAQQERLQRPAEDAGRAAGSM